MLCVHYRQMAGHLSALKLNNSPASYLGGLYSGNLQMLQIAYTFFGIALQKKLLLYDVVSSRNIGFYPFREGRHVYKCLGMRG